jgi:hypothetical protein
MSVKYEREFSLAQHAIDMVGFESAWYVHWHDGIEEQEAGPFTYTGACDWIWAKRERLRSVAVGKLTIALHVMHAEIM